MIRLCHVQVLPILTGVQRAMLDILGQLDRNRYELHVACQGPGPLTDVLERSAIRWHAIPALDRPLRPHRDWQAYRQLAALFAAEKFDIVHTHSSKSGLLGRVAARRAGVPCVVHTVQGFAFHEFSPPLKRSLFSRLERFAGRHCDRVLFVNHEELELSVRKHWLPADKCLTVYNGVDLAAVNPIRAAVNRDRYRQSWRLADDEVAILFAARLEPQKQPQILPAIADALRRQSPLHPWRLVIAGAGPARAEIERRIAALGLCDAVRLVGWQEDPHAALAAADVVLLPSLFEGLPLSLIEAQAAALPVVASNVKGNREVVTPGTGFLCPARNAQAYAERLCQLIDNPLERHRLGLAARRHAERDFDMVANSRRVAGLYEELLAAAGRESVAINRRQVAA